MSAPNVRRQFRHEYDAAQLRRLRARFLIWSGILSLLIILLLLIDVIAFLTGTEHDPDAPVHSARAWISESFLEFFFGIVVMAIIVGAFVFAARAPRNRHTLLKLGAIVLTVVNFMVIIFYIPVFLDDFRRARYDTAGDLAEYHVSVALSFYIPFVAGFFLAVSHFISSIMLPWSPRETWNAAWPTVVVNLILLCILLANAVLHERAGGWLIPVSISAALILVAPLPGLVWRYAAETFFDRRFHYAMLQSRHGEISRDLSEARRLHESLFPPRIATGSLQLDFAYLPMREIGGDFLFAFPTDPHQVERGGALSIVIADVTGHGVQAALSVNRIITLLHRLAEQHGPPSPDLVISELNSFAEKWLSPHTLFPSALALRISSRDNTIEWASAGHPTGIIRRAGGEIATIDSTLPLLGVVETSELEIKSMRLPFRAGDRVLACTDGLVEAMAAVTNSEDSARALGELARRSADSKSRASILEILSAEVERQDKQLRDDVLVIQAARLS